MKSQKHYRRTGLLLVIFAVILMVGLTTRLLERAKVEPFVQKHVEASKPKEISVEQTPVPATQVELPPIDSVAEMPKPFSDETPQEKEDVQIPKEILVEQTPEPVTQVELPPMDSIAERLKPISDKTQLCIVVRTFEKQFPYLTPLLLSLYNPTSRPYVFLAFTDKTNMTKAQEISDYVNNATYNFTYIVPPVRATKKVEASIGKKSSNQSKAAGSKEFQMSTRKKSSVESSNTVSKDKVKRSNPDYGYKMTDYTIDYLLNRYHQSQIVLSITVTTSCSRMGIICTANMQSTNSCFH
jgi:hypothetical protein